MSRDSCEQHSQGVLPPLRPANTHTTLLAAILSICFLALCLALTTHNAIRPGDPFPDEAEPGWVAMPAGARSAYLGIHGGTVPVSLLVTSTGNSLISFVGQTGNDFLALLRKAELRLPSLFNNSTEARDGDLVASPQPGDSAQIMAGSPTSSLPVISLSDDRVFSLTARPGFLQPFGLSETPLDIEGSVTMPDPLLQQPRYHILVGPQYLKPR